MVKLEIPVFGHSRARTFVGWCYNTCYPKVFDGSGIFTWQCENQAEIGSTGVMRNGWGAVGRAGERNQPLPDLYRSALNGYDYP